MTPAGSDELDVRLEAAMGLVATRMREQFHGRLRALDLTPPQFFTLKMLADEPSSMRLLANHLACDASNMTGIADRLEERGLVVRGPDPDDRRVKVLGLTRAGRAIVAKMDRPMATELSGYADLSDAEKRQLAALLEKAFG